MAVAFDAATASSEWRNPANGAADPFTFTHTPVGTPKGVVLFVIGSGTASDFIDGTVSYGGVAMTRIALATDTVVELGTSFCYFLGSGIPTGAQTVSIDYTGNTEGSFKKAICITLTAAADTAVAASGALSEDATNPSLTLDSGADTAIRILGMHTGQQVAGVTLGGGLTSVLSENSEGAASRSRQVAYQTTPGSGSTALGWTIAADDCALTGVAIKEAAASTGSPNRRGGLLGVF